MDVFNADTLFYLMGNLFRIYVTGRFLMLFFRVPVAAAPLRFAAFGVYFCVNSGLYLWFESPYLNLFVNTVSLFLLTSLYEGKWRTRILAVFLIFAVNLFSEGITYRYLFAVNSGSNVIAGGVLSSLLMFLLVLICEKLLNLKDGDEVSIADWIFILSVPLVSIFISLMCMEASRNHLVAALGNLGLLLLNILIFYLFDHIIISNRRKYEIHLLEQRQEALDSQLQWVEKMADYTEVLHHDIKNHLLAIRLAAQAEGAEGLVRYVDGIIDSTQTMGVFANCGNIMIDGMFNLKLSQAERMGARIGLQICVPVHMGIASSDLNIILGNLLDNAVQGMEGCEDKFVEAEMRFEGGVVTLRISNSCTGRLKRNGNRFMIGNCKTHEG